MKKKLPLTVVAILMAVTISFSQDYLISFAGSGASTTVNSVIVQNLTQDTSITISGNDILHLIASSGVEQIKGQKDAIHIYPNPTMGNSTVELDVNTSGMASIELYDITGKQITSTKSFLKKGKHTYRLNNLHSGIYTVTVKTKTYTYSDKIVSQNNNSQGIVSISYESSNINDILNLKTTTPQDKSTKSTVEMQYNDGDLLLFKGISGNYSTIVTLIPTTSTTVTFHFYSATDYDGNNYTVVEIGNQIWMAENLKVTHYPNGDPIPLVTDNTQWDNLSDNNTDDAMCYYNNNANGEADTYGVLYTYAASIGDDWQRDNSAIDTIGGQGVCPDGWHLPTDAEWTTLTDYLGGESVAGGKMKEIGTAHWSSPNTGADNSSGFSAFPGGSRSFYLGAFYDVGYDGYWWSSTELTISYAYIRYLYCNNANVSRDYYYKSHGFSVRCVRDY